MIRIDLSKPAINEAKLKHEKYFSAKVETRINEFLKVYQILEEPSLMKFPRKRIEKNLSKRFLNENYLMSLEEVYTKEDRIRIFKVYLKILNYLSDKRSDILIGEAVELDEIVEHIEHNFKKNLFIKLPNKQLKWNKSFKPLQQALNYIFDYNKLIKIKRTWDAFDLAASLDVKVCPYCNRQYTFTIVKKASNKRIDSKNKLVRHEFDHFYCQLYHPYLALSLFNLVPSCTICNSVLKHDKKISSKTHINPYKEGFEDDVKFRTGISVKQFIRYGRSANIIQIKLKKIVVDDKKKIKRAYKNVELFQLEAIYNEHKDIAGEIFRTSEDYEFKDLKKQFSEYDTPNTSFSKFSIDQYRSVLRNYSSPTDFGKRPLAKFTRDIAEETGLLQKLQAGGMQK